MIFNIYKTETDYVEFLKKDKFAINFLSSDQKDISKLFASKETNKAENVAHQISKNGNIIIDNTLGFIELKVFQKIDIADHVLVIGKVENLSIDENRNPLIYYRSEYRDLKQKEDS
jgi:flavin reductase (DIM6/NTAB) family NADH-FMN oxidoreductase RutF